MFLFWVSLCSFSAALIFSSSISMLRHYITHHNIPLRYHTICANFGCSHFKHSLCFFCCYRLFTHPLWHSHSHICTTISPLHIIPALYFHICSFFFLPHLSAHTLFLPSHTIFLFGTITHHICTLGLGAYCFLLLLCYFFWLLCLGFTIVYVGAILCYFIFYLIRIIFL